MSFCSKLGLGTVQWGMSYGIANTSGKPAASDVGNMLQLACESGIRTLDTAYAYGDAEKIIGEQDELINEFQLVTKTKPIQLQDAVEFNVDSLHEGFYESLNNLHLTQVYAVLFHDANILLSQQGSKLWSVLDSIKVQGKINKIGVSVYDPGQLEKIIDFFPIDIVQLPFNVYDQRFSQSGLLQQLNNKKIEVHTRSSFLQGILPMSPGQLPNNMHSIRNHHADFHNKCFEMGVSPIEASLGFSLSQSGIDKVLVGCETIDQLKGIIAAAESGVNCFTEFKSFALNDELIINPSLWVQ